MKQVEERYIKAEIAKFTPQEMREYETSKMAYRDIKNSVDTAKREGIAEGMEKGMKQGMEKGMKQGMEKGMKQGMEKGMKQGMEKGMKQGMEKGMKQGMEKGKHEANTETAQRLLAMGLSAEQVAKATQLPLEIIKNLSNS